MFFQLVFSSKPVRRPSPTPHDFFSNLPQSHNSIANDEKSKSEQWPANKCIKCNAPSNFAADYSALHAKVILMILSLNK